MSDELAQTDSAAVQPPTNGHYYLRITSTGETLGPLDRESVVERIAHRTAGPGDAVCVVGEQSWQPLLQSEFRDDLLAKIERDRLLSTTCPRCSSPMVALAKASVLGWILFAVGLVTSVACIGIPLVIVGVSMIWGKKRRIVWSCPQCGYSADRTP